MCGVVDFEWALAAPTDLEIHRCLKWLKTSPDENNELLKLLRDQLADLGTTTAGGIEPGSLRCDIMTVERLTSRLDSYKMWNDTPDLQAVALAEILAQLNQILAKHGCDPK